MADENQLIKIVVAGLDDLKIRTSEISRELRDIKSQADRTSSHLESEIGNINRQFGDLRASISKMSNIVYGNDGNSESGLLIRFDRLEQSQKRRDSQLKMLWSVVGTVFASFLIYILTSYFSKPEQGSSSFKHPTELVD